MTRLRDITEAELDSMYERQIEDMFDAHERANEESYAAARDRATLAECWLSMPIHEDEPHQRTVTLPEYTLAGARMSTITVRRYERRPVFHAWAEWHFLMVVNGRPC